MHEHYLLSLAPEQRQQVVQRLSTDDLEMEFSSLVVRTGGYGMRQQQCCTMWMS